MHLLHFNDRLWSDNNVKYVRQSEKKQHIRRRFDFIAVLHWTEYEKTSTAIRFLCSVKLSVFFKSEPYQIEILHRQIPNWWAAKRSSPLTRAHKKKRQLENKVIYISYARVNLIGGTSLQFKIISMFENHCSISADHTVKLIFDSLQNESQALDGS